MKYVSKKQQILNVLIIFFSSFLLAGLFAGYMIYNYSPTVGYLAANTILSPDVVEKISYIDSHPTTDKESKFIFNGIVFSYYDKTTGRLKQLPINANSYKQFYSMVESEKSLDNINGQVEREFNQRDLAFLTITVKTDSSNLQQATKNFQLIQFNDKDYFRVQLRGEKNKIEWAYFYKPGLYEEILSLFLEKTDNRPRVAISHQQL
ncbi:MAG: hypothetical protein H0W88_02070 [Parachlamydiaceae bacterium]|nr:hypothetical protein [Parachlamydiaceae bacterium]